MHNKNGKVVCLSGSFDLIHYGHVSLFKNAKAQGDYLIVLLNSDESIRSYKGKNRPVFTLEQRLEMLLGIKYIDEIRVFDDLTPLRLLEEIKPDIYVNGSDYGGNFLEKDTILKNGGSIFINQKKNSSSNFIKKIIEIEKTPAVKAIFFDRDGVLIKDKGYLHKVEDVEFMPNIFPTLKTLQDKGYLLVGVSNQSGIGRGMYTTEDALKVNTYIISEMKKKGVDFKEIFICPHTPKEKCRCRKPEIGMLLAAADKYDVALGRSHMIGDKLSDIEAGKMSNCKTVLLTEDGNLPNSGKIRSVEYPDFVIKSLPELTDII